MQSQLNTVVSSGKLCAKNSRAVKVIVKNRINANVEEKVLSQNRINIGTIRMDRLRSHNMCSSFLFDADIMEHLKRLPMKESTNESLKM